MWSKIFALVLSLTLIFGSFAQEVAKPNVVVGLELPSDLAVNYDEGFVNVQAKCKGEVKWLVVAGTKVKYVTVPQTNSIIISVPPQGGTISVFAVGLVDGKLTDFARTNINISDGKAPTPAPSVSPIQAHVTFLIDMNNPTPELAKLLNAQSLRNGLNQRGHWFRMYDIKSPIVTERKLDKVVGNNKHVMVIQSQDGSVLDARPIPATESEIFNVVNQFTGN